MLPRWVKIWFGATIPVILWDAGFVLMRPDSLPGGSWDWLWGAYELYLSVDRRYGDTGQAFVLAQTWMNLFEAALGAVTLWLAARERPAACLLAFSVALMTAFKTVLYFLVEVASGFASIGQAELWRILLFYVGMNGIWVVVPTAIVLRLGRELHFSGGS